MFKLSRNGKNVVAEVQRWQYFLLRNGISQVGVLDGQFGSNTEIGTKIFQLQNGLTQSGRADEKTLFAASERGYKILVKTYYKDRKSVDWPAKPNNLSNATPTWNNSNIGCFAFSKKTKRGNRQIVIKGDCDDTVKDWESNFIVKHFDDRLQFAKGYPGYIRCHKIAQPYFVKLFDLWEKENLLHLVLNFGGGFYPRYIKNRSFTAPGPHGIKSSRDVRGLSNHSYGSTFDISTSWNWPSNSKPPALCGDLGSVRELVSAANKSGFFWGGHYHSTKDGMHFELAKL